MMESSNNFPVTITKGSHPVTFRTRKLSPSVPMILPWQRGGKVGRHRDFFLSVCRKSKNSDTNPDPTTLHTVSLAPDQDVLISLFHLFPFSLLRNIRRITLFIRQNKVLVLTKTRFLWYNSFFRSIKVFTEIQTQAKTSGGLICLQLIS
jgi:hypothetical protein